MSDEARGDGKFKPIELESAIDVVKFQDRCRGDALFLARCLERYQRYRKGIKEYSFNEDPSKNLPMPFCPLALTIIEDEAIRIIKSFAKIKKRSQSKMSFRK